MMRIKYKYTRKLNNKKWMKDDLEIFFIFFFFYISGPATWVSQPVRWICWGAAWCRFRSGLLGLVFQSGDKKTGEGREGGRVFSRLHGSEDYTDRFPVLQVRLVTRAPRERWTRVLISYGSSASALACQLWVLECQIRNNDRGCTFKYTKLQNYRKQLFTFEYTEIQ